MKQSSLRSGLIHIEAAPKQPKCSAFILNAKAGCMNCQAGPEHFYLGKLNISLGFKKDLYTALVYKTGSSETKANQTKIKPNKTKQQQKKPQRTKETAGETTSTHSFWPGLLCLHPMPQHRISTRLGGGQGQAHRQWSPHSGVKPEGLCWKSRVLGCKV